MSIDYDQQDAPRLRDSIVLYMDLLGTRGVRTGDGALRHLLTVREAVSAAREATFSEGEARAGDSHMQWFSDNLAVGYGVEAGRATSALAQLVVEAGYLHLAFIGYGLPARGAIARGDFFADGSFVFGAALERAVELEKVRATFPRTVLDEASIAIAYDGLVEESDAPGAYWRRHLAIDGSGTVFVDYLGVAKDDPSGRHSGIEDLLGRHRDVVLGGLHRFDGSASIEQKYRWLAGYHNYAVRQMFPEALSPDLLIRTPRCPSDIQPFALPPRQARLAHAPASLVCDALLDLED